MFSPDMRAKSRRHFSEAEKSMIIKLYTDDKLAAHEIAARMERSSGTIINALRKWGVAIRGKGPRADSP